MKLHHVLIAMAAVPALSACQNQDADLKDGETARNKMVAQSDLCETTKVDGFIGMKADDAAKRDILKAVGTREVRYLAPGAAHAADQSPTRLNADLEADGTISMFWCG